jgi:hypothetical protein
MSLFLFVKRYSNNEHSVLIAAVLLVLKEHEILKEIVIIGEFWKFKKLKKFLR